MYGSGAWESVIFPLENTSSKGQSLHRKSLHLSDVMTNRGRVGRIWENNIGGEWLFRRKIIKKREKMRRGEREDRNAKNINKRKKHSLKILSDEVFLNNEREILFLAGRRGRKFKG